MRPRSLAWILALVWFVWLAGLQQGLAESERFARATPDLVTVLFVSLAGAVRRSDLALLALFAALARKTFSLDPPSAILAGSFALAALAWTLRAFVDIRSPLWRAALAAFGAAGIALWLEVVRAARERAVDVAPDLGLAGHAAWTSALAALALGGLLAFLPGLSPLRSKR